MSKLLIIVFFIPIISNASNYSFDIGYYYQYKKQYLNNQYEDGYENANGELKEFLSRDFNNIFFSFLYQPQFLEYEDISFGLSYYVDEEFYCSIDLQKGFKYFDLKTGFTYQNLDNERIQELVEKYHEPDPWFSSSSLSLSTYQLGIYLELNTEIKVYDNFNILPFLRLNLQASSISPDIGLFGFYLTRNLEPNIGFMAGLAIRLGSR